MFKIIHNYKHELDQSKVGSKELGSAFNDVTNNYAYINNKFCEEFDIKYNIERLSISNFYHKENDHKLHLHEDIYEGGYCITYNYIYHVDKTLTDMKFYFDGKIYDIKEKDLIIFDGSKTHGFYSYKGFGKRTIIVGHDEN